MGRQWCLIHLDFHDLNRYMYLVTLSTTEVTEETIIEPND